ncbi:MAG: Uma2 family endonuclease [Polyangiaceae bacterium]|jgi:Uma2 family endonuclease
MAELTLDTGALLPSSPPTAAPCPGARVTLHRLLRSRYTVRMQPVPKHRVSSAEYLALERAGEAKHELVNGEIVAMSGASPVHNLITMNLGWRLGELLAAKPCIVLSSDQRVHVPATGLFAYPDLTIVCGRPELHPEDENTLVNPRVIVEVLSESTEAYDRGAKFAHYQSITSLEEYVLVSTREKRVEHYRRHGSGQWLLTVHVGDEARVAFPALGGDLPLASIYEKVDSLARAQ